MNTPVSTRESVSAMVQRARAAAWRLATIPHARRVEALLAVAAALEQRSAEIVAANERDCAAARGKIAPALFKRLQTSVQGVREMAARVREVAALPDPIGRELGVTELDDGLALYKISCPLGVVAIIFEARPEVISQVASLTVKSGNAVILKGGSEAEHSNSVLASVWQHALARFEEIPADAITLLHTREDVHALLDVEGIDLIIPRGSEQFVRYIAEHSRSPVLGHGEGVCHVYVDRAADLRKAREVAFDSKVQYPAACNAAETLLVHADVAAAFLPEMIARFQAAGVEVRGCTRTREICPQAKAATEDDWKTEYSDLVISVRVLDSLDDAIAHVNRYGSKHTDCIVTEDAAAAARFLDEVDAAGVYHNASTRFADGFRYGLGAELGISTAKLHARGPVGLEGLTTYKYKLVGKGQVVATYARGERQFTHRKLK